MTDIADLSTFAPDLFAGRTVLVSGGTSGIGLAIARGFAGLGAEVIATGSSPDKLAALAGTGGPGLRFAALDVRDPAAVEAFCAGMTRLDVLVNAAGIARPEAEFDEATFCEVLDVNLTSAMRLSRAARPLLAAQRGAVVNFASMLSYLADASVPAYGASKAGILGLTRALAHAWGREGIRVNAVAPGYHRTAMTRPLWDAPASEAAIARRSALGRWGSAEDLVAPVVFLASPGAAFVTGAVLDVDGGYRSGNPVD